MQIKTKLQHQWATSVEIIDSIKQQSLKTGGGDIYYREFFKLSSKLIEYIELNKDISEISKELDKLRELNREFNILKTLSSLRVITKWLEEITGEGYLILILDYKGNSIRYIRVPEENII